MRLTILVVAALAAGGCKKSDENKGAEPDKAPPKTTAPADAAPAAEKADEPIKVADAGLATPESVLHDTVHDLYLVSNINGSPFEADGNGFISRVGNDGKVSELKWIDGEAEKITLNAPKGMAVASGVLYVADVDTVRKFDAVTGAPSGEIKIKGASFLNDVVAKGTTVYVSDSGFKPGKEGFAPSGTDAVYAIDQQDKVTKLVSGKDLNRPNGLLMVGDALHVVPFGGKDVVRIDPASKKKEKVGELPHGAADGVVATGDGRILVSSWECGCLMAGPPEGPFEIVAKDLKSPADIGWDAERKRVLVPHFEDSALTIMPLPAAGSAPGGAAPGGAAPGGEGAAAPAAGDAAPAGAAPAGDETP